MSHAILARKSEAETSSNTHDSSKALPGGLTISKPGDTFEQEADRVADQISAGNRIPAWSFSRVSAEHIQRQTPPPDPTQQPSPQPNNYKEGAEKLGEAFLKTDVGKKLEDAATQDPLVKGTADFVGTLPGKIIVGAAATGAVAGLAAEHKALPVQIPEIPLDKVAKGLKVKITYEGPVDRPTKGMITFSYTPGGDKKKKGQSDSDRIRADTARLTAEREQIEAHTTYPPGSPQDLEQESMQKAIEDVTLHRGGMLPGTGGVPLKPGGVVQQAPGDVPAPGLLQQPLPDTGLHLPKYQSPFAPKTPTLLDKQLELKPITSEPAAADAKKKEDLPVQRKADGNAAVLGNPAQVSDAVQSSGRPLDDATRRFMESRFGFDFGNVRIHTDARAAESAKAVHALAYTVGNDLVFREDHYAPHTAEGTRLLAHELTHVVQQSSPAAVSPRTSNPTAPQHAPAIGASRAQGEHCAIATAPPAPRGVSRRVQRKVEMRNVNEGEQSGYGRLSELIASLNRISQGLTFSLTASANGRSLAYTPRPNAQLSDFDTQMKGFIDQAAVIPMRLTNRHGLLGDKQHGYHTQITGDNAASGYVDIDDLLASDDLGLQEYLVHILRERTELPNYVTRIGSSTLDQSKPENRLEFLEAHGKGVESEEELMRGFFGDGTFQVDPDANVGPNDRAFINKTGDHIFSRMREGQGAQAGVQSLHVEVVTASGSTLTPDQYKALLQKKNSAGATPVQPKLAVDAGPFEQSEASRIEREALSSAGAPLDPTTQAYFETRFHHDFSGVRIHTDPRAAESAKSVGALAYTVGDHVAFADGNYQPSGSEGRKLLAHELTHVVQQSRGGGIPSAELLGGLERDADNAADAAASGRDAAVMGNSSPGLARATPANPASPAAPAAAAAPRPGRLISERRAPDGNVIDMEVGSAVQRMGLEDTLPTGTEVNLAGWQRAHQAGPGLGAESGTGIRYAPPEVNLQYQNSGIEQFIREFNQSKDADVHLFLRTVTEAHPNSLRLKSITYRLSAARGNEAPRALFETGIEIQNKTVSPRVTLDHPEILGDWKEFLAPNQSANPPASGSGPAGAAGGQDPPSSAAPKAAADTPAAGKTPQGTSDEVPKTGATPGTQGGDAVAPGTAGKAAVDPQNAPVSTKAIPAEEPVELPAGKVPSGIGTGLNLFAIFLILARFLPDPLEKEKQAAINTALNDALAQSQWEQRRKDLQPEIDKAEGATYYTFNFRVVYAGHHSPSPKFDSQYTFKRVEMVSLDLGHSEVSSCGGLTPPERPNGAYSWEASVTCTASSRVKSGGEIRKENRARENQKLIEKLHNAAPKAAPTPPPAPNPALGPHLMPPAPQDAAQSFNPLPGSPGMSPIREAENVVANFKAKAQQLIERGKTLASGSPSQDQINAFKNDEELWRAAATLVKNHFIDKGPDVGATGMDEVLNSDQYGGRLKEIRNTLGG